MNLSFFISWRYLYAKRKQVFISFISFISVAGIALGVSALVITLSIMNGFQTDLKNKILTTNPHIIIFSVQKDTIKDYTRVTELIKTVPDVKGAAPFIYGQGILKKGKHNTGIVLKGVTNREVSVTNISDYIKSGKFIFDKEKTVCLGKDLASTLGAQIDDEVIFISPSTSITAFGQMPKWRKFKVTGIIETGMYEYDSHIAYISLEQGQTLFDLKDRVTGIGVQISDPYKVDEVSPKILRSLGSGYWSKTWLKMNYSLFTALKLEKIVMFIIMVLIIIVAAFGIISSLTLMTIEKTRDIGILKAMGCSTKKVAHIFIYQGLYLGCFGTFTGLVLGLTVLIILKNYEFIKLPADIYYLSTVPVNIDVLDMIIVAAAAVLISLFSTLYPAYRAAKQDPSIALHYE
ncbi:lipoprotein-releasing ABC transporter permease subunit [bacterium]